MPPITKEILYDLIDLMVSASAQGSGGLRAAGEAWLNPQPIPPRQAAETPRRDPWRAAAVARQVISMAALSSAAADDHEAGLHSARSMLRVFVEDFCGTGPNRRFPLPPPWPRSGGQASALDLLVAAAQFQAVANALQGQPIAESLARAADRLLDIGLERFPAESS